MEAVEGLIGGLELQLSSALWTVATYGAIAAAIGFALAVIVLVLCHRRRIFQRRFRLWTALACVNFVYLPLLLIVVFGITGAIHGAHSVTGRWIDGATEPVVDYAEGFIPRVQGFVNDRLELEPGSGMTAEQVAAAMLTEEVGGDVGPIVEAILLRINLVLIDYMVDDAVEEMKPPELVARLRAADVTTVNRNLLDFLPRSLHGVANGYFMSQYLLVAFFAVPLMLLPLLEYGLHRGAGWVGGKLDPPPSGDLGHARPAPNPDPETPRP